MERETSTARVTKTTKAGKVAKAMPQRFPCRRCLPSRRRRACQQDHEPVFRPRRHGEHPFVATQRADIGARRAAMKRTSPPLRHRVHDRSRGGRASRAWQPSAAARRGPRRRHEAQAVRARSRISAGAPAAPAEPPSCSTRTQRAAFGLVHVGGGHQHRRGSRRAPAARMISHSSRRDSGSTPDRGFVQQQQVRRTHQRARQAQFLFHARPDNFPRARPVKRFRSVISSRRA